MTVTIKTVSVTYGRKLNLGEYNSANIDCTLWADVSDDEQDLDAVMRGLWEMAKNNVKTQLVPLSAKHAAQAKELYMGLPLELRKATKAATGYDPDDYDKSGEDNGYGSMPHEFGDQ